MKKKSGSPPREFDILVLLARHPGVVFTAEQIYERVWNEPMLTSNNTIMVHIRKIREKVELDPKRPMVIQTVWGVGYKVRHHRPGIPVVKKWIPQAFLYLYQRIAGSFRIQMVGMVLISAVCAWLSFGFTKYIFYTTEPYYTYPSNFGLQQRIKGLAPVIQQMQPDEINHSLNRQMKKTGMKLMIVSKEGDVLYHSGNVSETKVDLYQIQMKMARQEEAVRHDSGSREIVALYPFSLKNKECFYCRQEGSSGHRGLSKS